MPEQTKADAALILRLMEAAKRRMSPEEAREQRLSFVLGNLPFDSDVTREEVEAAIKRYEGEAA